MKGYQKIRANLHIKILVNATPFQYSKLHVSYKPIVWGVSSGYSISRSDNIEKNDFGGGLIDFATTAPDYFIPLSQRLNASIYPCQCKGADLDLPFLWPYNWVDMTVKKADGTDTLFESFSSLGRVYIDSFFPLRTASTASTQPINVTVYAWATDVELTGPTLQQAGPIHATASALADAAGSLTKIPSIAPYAAPVQGLMSMAATAAKAFGWSNPPFITASSPITVAPLVGLASPELRVLGEKLTLDPDNGLSVDPRTVGIPTSEDEFTFQSLVTRESYLTQFDWQMVDTPDQELFSVHVSPSLADLTTRTTTLTAPFTSFAAAHLLPLALPSQHFKYWHGSITYCFEVVASQMHRGRLRLSYDPAGKAVADNTGRLITRVFDLAEASKFEFTVPWMAPSEYLTNTVISGSSASDLLYSKRGIEFAAYSNLSHNGNLTLSVLNELASTSGTADCRIIVSVKGGQDLNFAYPMDIRAAFSGTQTYSNPVFVQEQSGAFVLPNSALTAVVVSESFTNAEADSTLSGSVPAKVVIHSTTATSSTKNCALAHSFAADISTCFQSTNIASPSTGVVNVGYNFPLNYMDTGGLVQSVSVLGHINIIKVGNPGGVGPLPDDYIPKSVQFAAYSNVPSQPANACVRRFYVLASYTTSDPPIDGPWYIIGGAADDPELLSWKTVSGITGKLATVAAYSSNTALISCNFPTDVWNIPFNTFAIFVTRTGGVSESLNSAIAINNFKFTMDKYIPPISSIWSLDTTVTDNYMLQQSGDLIDAPEEVVHETVEAETAARGEALVYMGEKTVSFRQLMHRSFLYTVIPIIPDATVSAAKAKLFLFALKIPRLVRPYGLDKYGIVSKTWGTGATAITSRFNLARNNPLHDILQCFLAYKGSIVYKFVDTSAVIPVTWDSNVKGSTVLNQGLDHLVATHSHQKRPFTSSSGVDRYNPFRFTLLDGSTAVTQSDKQFGFMPVSQSGIAHSVMDVQKHLTIVAPDYSKAKFHSANLVAQSRINNVIDEWRQRINPWIYDEAYSTVDLYGKGAMAQNVDTTGTALGPNATAKLGNSLQMVMYFMPGEDFNAFMFLNIPTSYRYKMDDTTNVWLAGE